MSAPPARRRPQGPSAATAERFSGRFDEIVSAAAELFQQKGYSATTIQDVAEAVGVLKGSLYHYIATKEDLLFAIVEDVYQAMSHAQDQRPPTGDPAEDVRGFIEIHAAMNAALLTKSAVFYQEVRMLVGDRRSLIREWRHEYEGRLKSLLLAAREAGSLRDDVDPGFTARAALGMVNAMHQWYRADGSRSPEEVGRAYADLVLNGVVVRAGREA